MCPTPAHSWTGCCERLLWGKVLGLAGGVGTGWEHLSPGDSDVLFNTVSVTIEMIWKEKYNPMASTPMTLKGY